MNNAYELYCLRDATFYESPTLAGGEDADFALARGPVPAGWERSHRDDWVVLTPLDVVMPPQGWKIHASACLHNAEEVSRVIWDYCLSRRIPFKLIRSEDLLFLRNAKNASRAGSGKFVTIYPQDEMQLAVILDELAPLLEGQPGPYVLSDLRCGSGPLYVRYGGFAERFCVGPGGELMLAIEDDTGTLVPDERGATFAIPPWVTLPDCLAADLEARNSTTVEEIPYRIESALHFSNAGGIYAGVDARSGERVVLKEARPHAGLGSGREDAVARLRREREVLERLAGLDVPRLRDFFVLGEHSFLVQDLIEGTLLGALLVERHPLLSPTPDDAALADYTAWALDLYERVERAVHAVHERGIVIGDLHPWNVVVREDGRVALIDWEVASEVADNVRATLGAPGFTAPATHRGIDGDRYALACLRLSMFLPLTALFGLDRGKARQLAAHIAEQFPVADAFLDDAVRVVAGADAPATGRVPVIGTTSADWRRARDSIAQAILASATPERSDRLFPGDIAQFDSGGLNVAHGAAGVLYALAQTGAARHPEHEDWLVRRALDPQAGTRLGFYDGLHGVAYVLERLDRRDDALDVLQICTAESDGKLERLGLDLLGGLSGIGLNLAHFAAVTSDSSVRQAASRVAEIVADRLGDEDDVPTISGDGPSWAGLTRGSSGPALLFLRLYESTGEPALLELAATALRQDLRRCRLREDDGTLQVDEGWRTMPYLADGSVGIGMVLDQYLRHRDDEAFAEAAAQIRRAASSIFYVEPGLFYGRAGMILSLSRRHPPGTAAARDPLVAAHVRRLAWHAMTFHGHLAFPGEQLLRLSMDLATGSAGIMLALGAALHDEPVHLPFLEGVGTHRPRARPGLVGSRVLTKLDDDLVITIHDEGR